MDSRRAPATAPARAMILAAGFGTRLGELTRLRPKPMLPICGAPLVRWAVLWLRHHGVREMVINLHHLGEQIVAELGDGSGLGVQIQYSHEQGMILGTGGGLRQARSMLAPVEGERTPIVVMNGKILLDLDLARLVAEHRDTGAEATMVMREIPSGERWGTPLHAEGNTLVSLLGEDLPGASPGPGLMFSGVHVFQPEFLNRIPPEGEQCVIRTAYRELFRERGVRVHVTASYWWEHSTPERYLQGVANVLAGKVDLPFAEHGTHGVCDGAVVEQGAVLQQPVWVGPGARIQAGAHVGPNVQVGANAVVGPHRVRDAIVWDRAVVTRDLQNEVLP